MFHSVEASLLFSLGFAYGLWKFEMVRIDVCLHLAVFTCVESLLLAMDMFIDLCNYKRRNHMKHV